jgi:hypothetical protein
VTWEWGSVATSEQWGLLIAFACPGDIGPDNIATLEVYTVSSGEKAKSYTLKGLTDGTFYSVVAVLLIATDEVLANLDDNIKPGDLGGEYADGLVFDDSANPTAIKCPKINKNFSLLDVVPGGGGDGGTYAISGGVFLPNALIGPGDPLPGTLMVTVSTSETFQTFLDFRIVPIDDLKIGHAPIPYEFTDLPGGGTTYYIAAKLDVGNHGGMPAVGDYAGKFNDGKVPAGLFEGTWNPSGEGTVPWPITLEADSGDNGFDLGSIKTGD